MSSSENLIKYVGLAAVAYGFWRLWGVAKYEKLIERVEETNINNIVNKPPDALRVVIDNRNPAHPRGVLAAIM